MTITRVILILAISAKYSYNDILSLTALTVLISLGNSMVRKILEAVVTCSNIAGFPLAICLKKK